MTIRRSIKRIGLWLISAVMFGVVMLFGVLWWFHNREVTLPSPDGPYPVGRIEYDWTDPARSTPFETSGSQQRALNVWIWYPAKHVSSPAEPAPYLPAAWVTAHEQASGAGKLLMQNLTHVHSHSIARAPLATDQASFPVIIMQPGLGPILPDYTTLAGSCGLLVIPS